MLYQKKKLIWQETKKEKKDLNILRMNLNFTLKITRLSGKYAKKSKKKSIVLQISKKSEKKDLKKIIDIIKKELIVT